ncbi:geranylgeranyl pyrophosphate synthetase [Naviculisporaceae sp. PSN 640]
MFWTERSRFSRYRRTGGYKRAFRQKEDDVPTTPAPPFGNLTQQIRQTDLAQDSKDFVDQAKIKDVKHISSYNWLDDGGRSSRILVPGKPPRWTPPDTCPLLREDEDKYFRDKNAARYPKHPMEPAVLATLDADPDVPTKTDIAACGSTIGNLLRFIRGQDKTFRMLVEKVDNTVFFVRRENSPRELIPEVRGYGHTFPQAYTTWDADVPGSVSHQRIVGYNFAGLDLVVRFEADGYLPSADTSPQGSATKSKASTETSVDDLADYFSKTRFSSHPALLSPSALQVIKGSSSVDLKGIFELKTRSIRSQLTKDHLAEELPRLWVSRIPNFILAFHTRGEFKNEDIQIKDVREDVAKWEKDHASDLAHLAALLHRVIDIVSRHPNGRIEVSHQKIGILEIHEQLPGVGDVLSAGVRARWGSLSVVPENEDTVVSEDDEKGTTGNLTHTRDPDDKEDDDDSIEWTEKANNDFTACGENCGYCGKCSY